MTGLKEALAALTFLRNYQGLTSQAHTNALRALESFIESAAQEQRDWEAIDSWLKAGEMHRDWDMASHRGEFRVKLYDTTLPVGAVCFDGATRAEALSLAAAWCRAEMGGGKT